MSDSNIKSLILDTYNPKLQKITLVKHGDTTVMKQYDLKKLVNKDLVLNNETDQEDIEFKVNICFTNLICRYK